MSYSFSKSSSKKLDTVHPELRKVIEKALELSTVDFTVLEGARTVEQQRENIKKGVSQTMKSNHLVQKDGFAHAVDLAPYPISWNTEAFFPIVRAMRQAAEELGINVRWGGAWCKLNGDRRSPLRMIDDYTATRRRVGNKVFIDAPHFELIQ